MDNFLSRGRLFGYYVNIITNISPKSKLNELF